jgi:ribosomal protein L22
MLSNKKSLRQMSLKDNEQYLEHLSKDKHLKYFDKIFLVYTYEDGYSPVYSSKVISETSSRLVSKMSQNFWENTQVRVFVYIY